MEEEKGEYRSPFAPEGYKSRPFPSGKEMGRRFAEAFHDKLDRMKADGIDIENISAEEFEKYPR